MDLTLRDLQAKMKKRDNPEKAKGFDNACPISGFIPAAEFHGDPQNTSLSLKINGEVRQQGTTADMIHRIVPLIAYMSRFFTLKAGDVILTGTRKAWGRCTAVTSWRSASTAWRSLPACCYLPPFGAAKLHRRARLVIRCTLNWQRRTPDERTTFLATKTLDDMSDAEWESL